MFLCSCSQGTWQLVSHRWMLWAGRSAMTAVALNLGLFPWFTASSSGQNLLPSLIPCRLGPSEGVVLCYGIGAVWCSSLPAQEEWKQRGQGGVIWKKTCSPRMVEQELMQLRASKLHSPRAEACAERSELSSPASLRHCILQQLITLVLLCSVAFPFECAYIKHFSL